MKPVTTAVAVLSSLVVGTLTYQHYPSSLSFNSNSREALRDALKEEPFVFNIKDKVIARDSGLIGHVTGIFPTDKLKYSVEMESSKKILYYFADDLARTKGRCATGPNYKFCFRDKVLLKNGWAGHVRGIFPNGALALQVDDPAKFYGYLPAGLARTSGACAVGSNHNFCFGDKVLADSPFQSKRGIGHVRGIFLDGKISVQMEPGNFNNYSASDLVETTPSCVNGPNPYAQGANYKYCPGDKVISKGGAFGYLKDIFPNGKFTVQIGNSTTLYSYPTNGLAQTNGACAAGYCVGDKVITNDRLSGYVSGIFLDGKLSVQVDPSRKLVNYSASELTHD